jgi:hypothetical protein
VLADLAGRITPSQEAELKAEIETFQNTLHFIRTGERRGRPPDSVPPPSLIYLLRTEIARSTKRADESIVETKDLGLTEVASTLQSYAEQARRVLEYLDWYWAGLPAEE